MDGGLGQVNIAMQVMEDLQISTVQILVFQKEKLGRQVMVMS